MDDWRLACFADHHVLMPDNGSAKRMECGCTDGRWAVGVGLCTFEACCFCVIVFAQMVLFLNTDVCPILPARCVRFGSWLPPSSIFFLCACVCVDRTYICVRRRFLPCCCIFRCRGTFFRMGVMFYLWSRKCMCDIMYVYPMYSGLLALLNLVCCWPCAAARVNVRLPS
jgi:hypothetical protein